MKYDSFNDPISERYASEVMRKLFSPRNRAMVWRDLWIALASSQQEMGLPVSKEQVKALEKVRDQIDFERVAELEAELRHDVMAHIHAFGELAPEAKGIIHLGATSCFITDNADLIILKQALTLVCERLLRMIHGLSSFAREHANLPILGLTHLQPAQLTTLGKRTSLWVQDLVDCYDELADLKDNLPFRGTKGATGTQATFLQLMGGKAELVQELENRIAKRMGFEKCFPLTGQTYSRSWDHRIFSRLATLGVVLHKYSCDLRLMQSWGETEEPFGKKQIGSSAMPYKRNPMKAERMSALSKLLMNISPGMASMAATQWMERTLDDSAYRRVSMPQGFLAADALLIIGRNIADGMVVHKAVIERRVANNLPFLAAEELLMHGVSMGGDRQDLHERIRQMSWETSEKMRAEGCANNLLELLLKDEVLGPIVSSLPKWQAERFVGLAPEQTISYLDNVVSQLPVPNEDDIRDLNV